MAVLIASYLLLVFALPIALSAVVGYRSLPTGRRCTQCGEATLRLCSRRLRLASVIVRGGQLQQRWCPGCGWEGAARVAVPARTVPVRSGEAPRRSTQTLDVRSLDVDGAAWRVMLQCWGRTGTFYGRFVFVAPTGRLWLDAVESFSGSDHHDVLGQALSLPETQLENRLRRLVTDR